MPGALRHCLRLGAAARTIASRDGFMSQRQIEALPRGPRLLLGLAKIGTGRSRGDVTEALAALGPSYIKLGQFLATRADLVGGETAKDLARLQDRLPPFATELALREVQTAFGVDPRSLFSEFGAPFAAASIAQVHRCRTTDGRDVAVKVLRPGIEKRFADDLESFAFAARVIERLHEPVRRLRPTDAVETLANSVALEMDLRMEAAAIAEMAENTKSDPGFRVPAVDWMRTSRRVLTTEWIEGVAVGDVAGLKGAGFLPERIGEVIIQSFLRHAIRDGFFHADMHPGNLFVDRTGDVVAVDFGIMGRLAPKERQFLAEILFGFITKDYARVANVHFDAGYVPGDQNPAVFAQALRAIGEPLMDKTADDISMARLLTQLFQVTGQFNMRTQPQLLLLQKTMVVVEGVARNLNPRLNMWTTAEPVVREWIETRLGPQGRLEDAAAGAATLTRLVSSFPEVLSEAQRATHMLSDMAQSGGLRLDRETTEALARVQARNGSAARVALWIGAAALVVIALAQVF